MPSEGGPARRMTWLGPDAPDEAAALVRTMQRRAFDVDKFRLWYQAIQSRNACRQQESQ